MLSNRLVMQQVLKIREWPPKPMPSSRCRMKWILVCLGVSARFLHGFCGLFQGDFLMLPEIVQNHQLRQREHLGPLILRLCDKTQNQVHAKTRSVSLPVPKH